MTHMVPLGHDPKPDNLRFANASASGAPLRHVYEFLNHLVRMSGCRRIIDVGCGSATKLGDFDKDVEVTCLGAASARDSVTRSMPRASFIECDLNRGIPELCFSLRDAIIVCADIIEQLSQPTPLIRDLASLSHECTYVLISTPDRARSDIAHPTHTVKWAADEFGRLLVDCGFPKGFFLGHTFNNDASLVKNTTLVLAGREATFAPPDQMKSVAAIINVFNEKDILEHVARYLHDQGVQVHIVDNWSTDGSYEIANALVEQAVCANVVRFPTAPPADYDWLGLLRHAAEYGAALQSDWVIHYDADELRYSPWTSVTLTEAISFVDGLGYTAIDFTVLNFGFTDGDDQVPFSPGARGFFDFGRHTSYQVQIKAWKNQGQIVDLGSSGGHIAKFTGSRVFPLKFLTKHYPLRSTIQATTKLFRDRLPRFARETRELGWHTHYDIFRQVGNIQPWRQHELRSFDPIIFDTEFLVERLSGIGIETEDRAVPNINTIVEWLKIVKSTEAELRRKIEDLECNNLMLGAEVAAMMQSTSWRITAPIRGLKTDLMRAFLRSGNSAVP
jgi:hypothetical protein